MHALVIGGNGFLGSHLVVGLRGAGHGVRVLDRSVARTDLDWHGIDYRRGRLEDPAGLDSALHGIDIVFHLASSTVPATSNLDPISDVQANLVGILRLLAAMERRGLRRVVFFSSGGAIYGNADVPLVREDHPLLPISSYGVVKLAMENYLMMFWRLGRIDPLILRPSNVYGPRQPASGPQGVVGSFLARAMTGECVTVRGDGRAFRDYLHVDDLVELAVSASVTSECGIFNVGTGIGCSLETLCELIRHVTERPLPVQFESARDSDVSRIVLDIGAASRKFAWTPRIPLLEGLKRTWWGLNVSPGVRMPTTSEAAG